MKKVFLFLLVCYCSLYPAKRARAQGDACNYKLSKSIIARDYKSVLLVSNYLTEKQFILDKSTNELNPVIIDSASIARVYTKELQLSDYYKEYLELMKENSQLRPRLTAINVSDADEIKGCLVSYFRESAEFRKILSLVTISKQGRITDMTVIDTSVRNLNEYQFFMDKHRVYFISMNEAPNTAARYKLLTKLQRSGHFYKAEGAPFFELSDYLITNGVLYNYVQTSYSNGYFTTGALDYVGSLSTGAKIALPVDKAILSAIRLSQGTPPAYMLDELRYDAATEIFTILYRLQGIKYVATFKAGDKTFRTQTKIIEMKRYMDVLKMCCLSYDGKQLVYILKDENCVRSSSFAYFEEHYAR